MLGGDDRCLWNNVQVSGSGNGPGDLVVIGEHIFHDAIEIDPSATHDEDVAAYRDICPVCVRS